MSDHDIARNQLDADSLLLLNVGTTHTRASLVDIVERQYRMVATADCTTTADAPYSDVGEGVRAALDQLSNLVGCEFFDETGQLIVPSRGSGSGVDAVVLTLSLQADVRVALVGLLPDISLRSVRKVTESAPVRVVAEVSLGDRRTDEGRMDTLCQTKPDLILIAGGSEGGASEAVLRLMEVVGLSIYMMPPESRPQVLFMGNSAVAGKVEEMLKSCQCTVTVARNIRPSLENEDLDPGRVALNEMTAQILRARLGGIEGLLAWTGGVLTPSPLGLGTIIQLLGRSAPPKKGALGVSVGSGSMTLAAAFGDTMELSVRPDLNLGRNAPRLLELTSWRYRPLAADGVFGGRAQRLPAQQSPFSADDPGVDGRSADRDGCHPRNDPRRGAGGVALLAGSLHLAVGRPAAAGRMHHRIRLGVHERAQTGVRGAHAARRAPAAGRHQPDPRRPKHDLRAGSGRTN
jgi:hypothetical protein